MKWFWDNKLNCYCAEHNPTIRADKNGNVFGGGSTKISTPNPPAAPTTAESMQDWITNYPAMWEMQQKYAPQEAAQQVQLAQQYAGQYGQAMKSAQEGMYPQETMLNNALTQQIMQGMGVDPASLGSYQQQMYNYTTPEQNIQIPYTAYEYNQQELTDSQKALKKLFGPLYSGPQTTPTATQKTYDYTIPSQNIQIPYQSYTPGTSTGTQTQGQVPDWMREQYLSDLRANLGTNIGSGIGADYTSQGLLQMNKDWGDYYRNLALSVTGRQPIAQATTPQTSNYASQYTPNAVMGYNAQNYGNFANTYSSMYGSNQQAASNPWWASLIPNMSFGFS